jgi:hypothetical protein
VTDNRRPMTCEDIQRFNINDEVDLWRSDSWEGPYTIVEFHFDPATDHSRCAAHVKLRKMLPIDQEPRLADPLETEELEEELLLEGEPPTIRKVISPAARQRFTVKRADGFPHEPSS